MILDSQFFIGFGHGAKCSLAVLRIKGSQVFFKGLETLKTTTIQDIGIANKLDQKGKLIDIGLCWVS